MDESFPAALPLLLESHLCDLEHLWQLRVAKASSALAHVWPDLSLVCRREVLGFDD